MIRRRRLAILILAATLSAEAAQAHENLEPYAVAKRWSDVNLVPLALPGQTLQQAFERLSASGLWCTIHADPTLFCRASTDLPSERCKSISVIVSADEREWPKAPEVADRIGDVLGRHVSSASPFCVPALPDWSAEKFEPTTAAAQDAVRDAARIRAAAAPDLRRLSWQLLAEGAACSLIFAPDGARLSCTDGSLDSHICSDAAVTFVAPALQGTPPTLAAWRCDRGAHVSPPPDPNEHDKWAELGVFYVAQVCAMQDPAWRSSKPLIRFQENRVRDWTSIDS